MSLDSQTSDDALQRIIDLLHSYKQAGQPTFLPDNPPRGVLQREALHRLLDAMLDLGTRSLQPQEKQVLLVAGRALLLDACAPLERAPISAQASSKAKRSELAAWLATSPTMLPSNLRRDLISALAALNSGRTPPLLERTSTTARIDAKQGVEQWVLLLIEFWVGAGHRRDDVVDDVLAVFKVSPHALRRWGQARLKDQQLRSPSMRRPDVHRAETQRSQSRLARAVLQKERIRTLRPLAAEWRALGGAGRPARS